eukprot:jgi/Galph1/328/GphlegSOOS_G5114.1
MARQDSTLFYGGYRKASGWLPQPVLVFIVLGVVRITSGLIINISDCDETFNYWEPLHYLLYGYGFQTWEYSPKYCLRSYAYLLPFAALVKLASYFPMNLDKVNLFLFVRSCVGLLCAGSETYLYDSLVLRFGGRIALWFLIFSTAAPGMFVTATSILPSSFALIILNFAVAFWLVRKFRSAILCVSVASLLGWPFVGLIGVPLAFDTLYNKGALWFCKQSLIFACFNLLPIIDFLQRFSFQGKGSELFGTEPWYYYILNGLVNFNVLFVIGVFVLPLLFVLFPLLKKRLVLWDNRQQWLIALQYSSPLYLWLSVFICQPHKEERFLFPVFSLICVCGAICCEALERAFHSLFLQLYTSRNRKVKKHSIQQSYLRHIVFTGIVTVFLLLSVSRIIILIRGYRAPLVVYKELSRIEWEPVSYGNSFWREYNVCIGKEWYRFTSHFFVPSRQLRIRWIPSGFDGMLPQYFDELGVPQGTRKVPTTMNDQNRAVPEQFFYNSSDCDYLVDFEGLTDPPNSLILGLKPIISKLFLDSKNTPRWKRVFYIPFISHEVIYGKYVVYSLPRRHNNETNLS